MHTERRLFLSLLVWLVLICCERKVLMADWWLICSKRKVLLAGG
jgi:hypothetical protein